MYIYDIPLLDSSAATKRTKRKFECLTCNKKFASKSILYNHKKIHEKAFVCNICLKCFGSKQNLDIHNRTHTGEKPYVCSTVPSKKCFTLTTFQTIFTLKHFIMHLLMIIKTTFTSKLLIASQVFKLFLSLFLFSSTI